MMIRRMVNTSELVGMEKRIDIINKYAQKLINSEYSLEQARNAIVGGLKGYERLLSLSKDMTNPRWKPLHLSAGWNPKNRRVAKLRAKNNWYRGKTEVEHPSSPQQEQKSSKFSIHKGDLSNYQEEHSIQQEEQVEQSHILPGGSRLDTTLAVPVGEMV